MATDHRVNLLINTWMTGFPSLSNNSSHEFPTFCLSQSLRKVIIGTLSNDDDGSENVAKKMNLRSFKLYRVYLDPLNMSNAGDFSWCWQGHPTTVFWEISVRSPLEWLKFSRAQEQLKISKIFRGDWLLGSEFRDLCGLFTYEFRIFVVISRFWFRHLEIS